jgi:hypothetical protein
MVGEMDQFDVGDVVGILDYEGRYVIISIHIEHMFINGVTFHDRYYKCQNLVTTEIIEACETDLYMISPKKGRESRILNKRKKESMPPLESEDLNDFLDEYITLMSLAELYDKLGMKDIARSYMMDAKEVIMILEDYNK